MNDAMPHGHVLLVEDDAGTRTTLHFILERAGYCVTPAPDGETALALLAEAANAGWTYDVVLTDIVMGYVDGIEVIRRGSMLLNAVKPAPVMILLTGYASLDTAVAALRYGVFDYLRKPCKNTELLECVARAVAQRAAKVQQVQTIQLLTHTAMLLQEQIPGASSAYCGLSVPQPEGGNDDTLWSTRQPDNAEQSPMQAETLQTTVQQEPHYISIGALCIDCYRQEVTIHNQPIHLTPYEYTLLLCMVQSQGRVLSPIDIVRFTHGYETTIRDARALIKPHVLRLRYKLPEGYLVTVRGKGYMFVVPDDSMP